MAKFLTNIDLSKNQLQNALLHPLAIAPSNPSAGQVYFNTENKKLFVYTGAAWEGIGEVDGVGILTLINEQSGKIDLKNLDLEVFTSTTDGLVPKTGTPSGKFLKDDKTWATLPNTTVEIVDNLNDASTTKALSANQGKVLKDDLDNRVKTNVPVDAKFTDTITTVVDNLNSTSATSALSANQGKVLDGKIGTAEASAKSYADTKAGLAETAANQYTDTEIANLVGSSPEALNTLEELAAALGSDANFATTVTNQLASKIDKYAANVGGATSQVITHNLNSRDVAVSVYENSSPYAEVYCDVERTSVNTVTLKFAKAPAANEYRVVITG